MCVRVRVCVGVCTYFVIDGKVADLHGYRDEVHGTIELILLKLLLNDVHRHQPLPLLPASPLAGTDLQLSLLDQVHQAGKVHHKLAEHRAECVEVEDVWKRTLL